MHLRAHWIVEVAVKCAACSGYECGACEGEGCEAECVGVRVGVGFG